MAKDPETPSFTQAADEKAHREQNQYIHGDELKRVPVHQHGHHHSYNRSLRDRQNEGMRFKRDVTVVPTVTRVVKTIAVVQQINVDTAGNIIGTSIWTTSSVDNLNTTDFPVSSASSSDIADSEMNASTIATRSDKESAVVTNTSTKLSVPTSIAIQTSDTTDAILFIPTEATPSIVETSIESAIPQVQSSTSELPLPQASEAAEAPAAPAFTTIVPEKNGTSLMTLDLVPTNSSFTSLLSSTMLLSSTDLSSKMSALSDSGSTTLTMNAKIGSSVSYSTYLTTSAKSATTWPTTSTMTGYGFSGGGTTNHNTDDPGADDNPFPTSDNDGSGSGSATVWAPGRIAGTTVGSIAGLSLIVVLIYGFFHWRKTKGKGIRLSFSRPMLAPGSNAPGAGDNDGSRRLPEMKHQSIFAMPAWLIGPGGRNDLGSEASTADTPGTGGTSGARTGAGAEPERAFYRVSGRKLPSVLQHGGDGYSDPTTSSRGPAGPSNLNDTSFYSDDAGLYGGAALGSSSPSDGYHTATDRGLGHSTSGLGLSSSGTGNTSGTFGAGATLGMGRGGFQQTRTPPDPDDTRNPFTSPNDVFFEDDAPAVYREGPGRRAVLSRLSPSNKEKSSMRLNSKKMDGGDVDGYRGSDMLSPPGRRPGHFQDGLGRSHPSRDGSHTSRFQEDV